MIYLKAKIQDLLDVFELRISKFEQTGIDATDYHTVAEARQAIIDYWERGEA